MEVNWTIKKVELQRTDAFELWCWRRLLRAPGATRRSNQSVLKEINSEYSLEGLVLNLKFQYLGPPDVKSWFIKKDPDAGKDWRQEKKGMTEDEMVEWHHRFNRSLSKLWGVVKDWDAWHAAVHGVAKSQTCLSDWKTTLGSLFWWRDNSFQGQTDT